MVEFRQMQYFACLVEEGSVTRAARRLNIVQPALSMQIGKLEDDVGQRLFDRTAQGMRPTAEGRRLYQVFLPVLNAFSHARGQINQPDGELSGPARIGMIATIAQGVLVDALLEFSGRHPKVELSLTDGFSGTLTDAVAVGQLDAAVINKPRRPLTLTTSFIAEEAVELVTGPAHAEQPATLSLRDVANLKLALPTRQHGLRGILESFAQAEDIRLEPAVEIDAIGAIVKLVRESDFATLLPSIAVRQLLEDGAVLGHEVHTPRLVRQIVCVSDPRRPLSPAAAAFVEVLSRHVRGIRGVPDALSAPA